MCHCPSLHRNFRSELCLTGLLLMSNLYKMTVSRTAFDVTLLQVCITNIGPCHFKIPYLSFHIFFHILGRKITSKVSIRNFVGHSAKLRTI